MAVRYEPYILSSIKRRCYVVQGEAYESTENTIKDYYNFIFYVYTGPNAPEELNNKRYELLNGLIITIENIKESTGGRREVDFVIRDSNNGNKELIRQQRGYDYSLLQEGKVLMFFIKFEPTSTQGLYFYCVNIPNEFWSLSDSYDINAIYRYVITETPTTNSPGYFNLYYKGRPCIFQTGSYLGVNTELNDVLNKYGVLGQYDGNPYQNGGYNDNPDPTGGTGDFDNTTEPVPVPDLPAVSIGETKLVSMYNPTAKQLKELSDFIWSPKFSVDTIKKLYADPMDFIMGLSAVPCSVNSSNIGNLYFAGMDTGIPMKSVVNQFTTIDCGTLSLNEYWGGYLDYEPFTKLEIYLPYIGTKQLSVDELMGLSINVTYRIDVFTGSCVAYISAGGSVLYTFTGQCSMQIPVQGRSYDNLVSGLLNSASYVASASTAKNPVPGITNSASAAVNAIKPSYSRTGSVTSSSGFMAIQKPYLILTRPNQVMPGKYGRFVGFPSYKNMTIGEAVGYTEVQSVHLEGIDCTAGELEEIEKLLKEGVIV